MQDHRLSNSRRGMTLVELLVVVAIMVTLLAVSVPLLKPMLESRRTSNAAQVLAGAFQQARLKAIQEGTSYGVRLVPFETTPTVAPTTAVQLQFQKEGFRHDLNPHDIRVRVVDGEVFPYHYSHSNGKWESIEWDKAGIARNHVLQGYSIQFNRMGRYFVLDDNFKLKPPYDALNLPALDVPDSSMAFLDAMEYRIVCLASAALWIPPVMMPRGTIVDLVFSGGETYDFAGGEKSTGDIPPAFSPGDEVIVMFSPGGYVDLLYINGNAKKVNEMLYFCVGEWDRQIDTNTGKTFAEDGKSNLDMPATFWVSLHPKTGGVRIAENAPIKPASIAIADTKERILHQLRDARKFAKEHFFNVGGR